MKIKYECQDMFSHEIIATFDTYDEADNFMTTFQKNSKRALS